MTKLELWTEGRRALNSMSFLSLCNSHLFRAEQAGPVRVGSLSLMECWANFIRIQMGQVEFSGIGNERNKALLIICLCASLEVYVTSNRCHKYSKCVYKFLVNIQVNACGGCYQDSDRLMLLCCKVKYIQTLDIFIWIF